MTENYERFGYLPNEKNVPLIVSASILDPEFASYKPNLTPLDETLAVSLEELARKIAQETGPVPPLREDTPP